jgi:hypothetical protein
MHRDQIEGVPIADPIVHFLHDFRSQPARYHSDQAAILEWIAAAHAQVEITIQQPATEEEQESITRKLRKLVLRFGCSTDRVAYLVLRTSRKMA